MIQLVPKQDKNTVLNRLGFLRRKVAAFTGEETRAIGGEFTTLARLYPPETEANSPPPIYYTRGVGKIGAGGRVIRPSENLGAQWSVTQNGDVTEIQNDTIAAPYVHGTTTQAWFHKARGWQTIRQLLEKVGIIGDENSAIIISQAHPRYNGIKSRLSRLTRGVFDF